MQATSQIDPITMTYASGAGSNRFAGLNTQFGKVTYSSIATSLSSKTRMAGDGKIDLNRLSTALSAAVAEPEAKDDKKKEEEKPVPMHLNLDIPYDERVTKLAENNVAEMKRMMGVIDVEYMDKAMEGNTDDFDYDVLFGIGADKKDIVGRCLDDDNDNDQIFEMGGVGIMRRDMPKKESRIRPIGEGWQKTEQGVEGERIKEWKDIEANGEKDEKKRPSLKDINIREFFKKGKK